MSPLAKLLALGVFSYSTFLYSLTAGLPEMQPSPAFTNRKKRNVSSELPSLFVYLRTPYHRYLSPTPNRGTAMEHADMSMLSQPKKHVSRKRYGWHRG